MTDPTRIDDNIEDLRLAELVAEFAERIARGRTFRPKRARNPDSRGRKRSGGCCRRSECFPSSATLTPTRNSPCGIRDLPRSWETFSSVARLAEVGSAWSTRPGNSLLARAWPSRFYRRPRCSTPADAAL